MENQRRLVQNAKKYYTMKKCPACGYDTSNRRKNVSQSIRKLLAVRGRKQ